MKSKKIKIVISSQLILLLIEIIIIFNFETIKTFYYEVQYKRNSNEENLIKLCLNIKSTEKYNKKIKYYPILLDNDKAFNDIGKYTKEKTITDKLHDDMQCQYLLSYLYTDKFSDFKNKYIEYFPKFKIDVNEFHCLSNVICWSEIDRTQLKIILETLQQNYPKLEGNYGNELRNVNLQAVIYDRLGDSINEKLARQKADELTKIYKEIKSL